MGKNWGIAIGINNYSHLSPLKYAQQDAAAILAFWHHEMKFDKVFFFGKKSPINTFSSTSYVNIPTYGHIRHFLTHPETPKLQNGDKLWFFFAGHGLSQNDRDYLMFADSDEDNLAETALSVSRIAEDLRGWGADNVLLFLDACRSNNGSNGLGIGKEKEQGVITFYACQPEQISHEIPKLGHGAFTHALLAGLRLQGKYNYATVGHLDRYIRHQVTELCDDPQTPYVNAEPSEKYSLILFSQATPRGSHQSTPRGSHQSEIQQTTFEHLQKEFKNLKNEYATVFDAKENETDPNKKAELERQYKSIGMDMDRTAKKMDDQKHRQLTNIFISSLLAALVLAIVASFSWIVYQNIIHPNTGSKPNKGSPQTNPSVSPSPTPTDTNFALLKQANNFTEVSNAITEIRKGNEQDALNILNDTISKHPENPEAYIYRNNILAKQLEQKGKKRIILAAVIPASSKDQSHRADEMLQGIVLAQNCFNNQNAKTDCLPNKKHDKYSLEIQLYDDRNDGDRSRQIAEEIGKQSVVKAVIGHYSSQATIEAINKYQNYRKLVISPSSSSSNVKGDLFFRGTPPSEVSARAYADYINKHKINQTCIFRDQSDPYSQDLSEKLKKELENSENNINTGKKVNFIPDDKICEDYMNQQFSNTRVAFILIPPSSSANPRINAESFLKKSKNIANSVSTDSILMGGQGLLSSSDQILEHEFEEMIVGVPWFSTISSEAKNFADRSQGLFKKNATWVTANSYDATQALMMAIASSKEDLSDIADRLKELDKSILPVTYTSGKEIKFPEKNTEKQDGQIFLVKVVSHKKCTPKMPCSDSRGKSYQYQLIDKQQQR